MDPSKMELLMEQQFKLIQMLAETKIASTCSPSTSTTTIAPSIDGVANSIAEFHYDPDSNITFDMWFRRYEDLFKFDFATQDDAWKVRLLLRKLGPSELDKYCNLILPQNPRDRSFADTVQSLSQQFGDNSSLFNIRYRCLKLIMNEDSDFLTHVGIVNRECERFRLKSLTEDQFKALILIWSLQSQKFSDIRTRLLCRLDQDPKLTLNDIANEYQRLINIQRDTTMIQSGGKDNSEVHAVRQSSGNATSMAASSSSHSSSALSLKTRPPSACWHCGAWHFIRFCPYKHHRCRNCKSVGHKDGYCKRQKLQQPPRRSRNNRKPFSQPSTNSLSLLASCQASTPGERKFLTLYINAYPFRLQVDTASDITIISKKAWIRMGRPRIEPTTQKARTACGNYLRILGQLTCVVSFRDMSFTGVCYVTTTDLNLLGLDWFDQLQLADVPLNTVCRLVRQTLEPENYTAKILAEFPTIFQPGLGCCTSMKATLRIQKGAKPVFRPKRPVPYAALPKVDEELNRLQQQGVITPVSYSAWAAPIVVIKKPNGSIRICADFSTGLNAALEQHHYPLPVPADLFTMLNGGKFFAKLDLADAYLQEEVAEESRELLTINTHRGMFQYNRLPFGVKTAPSIFQQLMDTILAGIAGVATYLDDILIVATSPEELRERTTNVLQRISENGFRLRPEKCQFFLESVKYLGFIFDAKGRRPDPENIRAIQLMPAPTNVSALRSFLGLVSYYSAFVPSMHVIRSPLNHLLHKDVTWNWTPDCEAAFNKLKSLISSRLLLTHYDPSMPIIVAADASSSGLGAVISHQFPDSSEKAIMHASRTLTPAERKYSQIEKEALALVFAVRRFHKFLYGRRFTLLTDHKPLLTIFGSKSGIPAHSANHLQRWALILLGYDFDIQYRHTQEFGQADALSRLISEHATVDDDTIIASLSKEDYAASYLTNAVRALPVSVSDIQIASRNDAMIRRAMKYVTQGWPRIAFEGDMKQLYQRRDSLCVVDDCLMFGERVVVPKSLQPRMLQQFHSGHPGTWRMKSIARSYAYWPLMDQHIIDLVRRCTQCQQAAKFNAKAPPIAWPQPENAWSRIHIDFAGPVNGVTYLVVVDAFSKWPEIFPVVPPSTTKTLQILSEIFSRNGLPDMIVSDNGSQFTSSQFQEFCRRLGIIHYRFPPYHPQSNGQAERFVDTFKRALLKSKGEETPMESLQNFLFVYRTTPNDALPERKSPAEALMGRKLKTIHKLMLPSRATRKVIEKLPAYEVGCSVYARDYRPNHSPWMEARVVERRGQVMDEVDVKVERWTRHRNQLRKRAAADCPTSTRNLPLEVLLDTFNLPPSQVEKTEQKPVNIRSRRQSLRQRRQTVKLQVNPRNVRY
uniref:Gag-Pol polyprotein n=1 Tax=Schistosoma japonicum TaxID=6182 RepID=C7C200_SCHJA|nr:Gag-Pol polyprotein [Schistosoma japonicum]